LRSGELPLPIDTEAPVIFNATPSGLSCDAESPVNISLAVNTNELAYCRYSTSDVDYLQMTAFSSTGGYSHSSTISLACDASYTYYVRCRDQSTNQNTNSTSTSVAFTINAAEAETEAPVITNATPSGAISCSANPMTVTLALIATDEGTITCKYDTDNVAYASMGGDNGGDMSADTTSLSQFIDDSYEVSTSIAYRHVGASYSTESGVSFVSDGGNLTQPNSTFPNIALRQATQR